MLVTRSLLPAGVTAPAALGERLGMTGYLADPGLSAASYLAIAMGRPLLLEGEAGTGKTALATALAELLGAPLIRLQCYEGIDASQALYDWDFPRQLLHLRASEAAGSASGSEADVERLEGELYTRRFLLARPLLQALETTPSVLLIDEVDRADDEFEAFLLEVLSEYSVSIPELGTVRAEVPPVVVLTSNRTRELHDALKRRCFYHWLAHPSVEREVAILQARLPEVTERLARQVAVASAALRDAGLVKAPGVAESLDWAHALLVLGAGELDPEAAAATLGAVLKYREDQERAAGLDWRAVLAGA
jgi:MoxR-like ATPase